MEREPARVGDSILLYCPYERQVTQHARRAPGGALVCVECGRPVDSDDRAGRETQQAVHDQRTSRFTPIARPQGTRAEQVRPRQRRGSAGWLPLAATAAALVVGGFAAINVAGNLAAPAETVVPAVAQATPAPNSGGQPTQAAPIEEQRFVRIGNTDGQGAYVRRTTNLDDRLRPWPDNTRLRVVGPDTTVNGTVWRPVEDPAGNQGWVPAQYTRPE